MIAPVDDLGEPVPLRGTPATVVSLVPSITEAIAVTAPGLLTGATDYCTHPSTLDVIRVGGSKYPDVDAILALHPDLVVGNAEENRPQDVQRLRANGIPVWVTEAAAGVPGALGSLRRLLTQAIGATEPDWLTEAESVWRTAAPLRATAIVPVWRRPWVVLGRDTFAGDVLRRVGIGNAFDGHTERYPRPSLAALHEELATGRAGLVVLPDEPYAFTAQDGPDAFPGTPCALISGRDLTWYGPSLVTARDRLTAAIAGAAPGV